MLLIDSLYINNSGGLRLLEYLINVLHVRGIKLHLLADKRCLGVFDTLNSVEYLETSMKIRKIIYSQDLSNYSAVLCFGNIPPLRKLSIPVYTYFHNINLLTLEEARSKKELLIMWLKREVFRHYRKNTDYWLVQTANTATELCKNLSEPEEKIKLMPFYELSPELLQLSKEPHGDDYVYISNYTGAKGHEELLEAWRILHKQGLDKILHLTVPLTAIEFCERIKAAQNEGVKVVNHGFVPFDEVIELYRQSKAIIYPSHNESLGLGIVEAITAGCDVIGSDLPFIHAVCKPSAVFNPYSSKSIANSIAEYEQINSPKSVLLIENKISDLVKLLS